MEINNEITFKNLFYNRTTSATEKIKIIKDKFGLTLKDLAGDDLSINCVSKILLGHQGITKYSGKCLAKNINTLLNLNIQVKWLLEDISVQANRLLKLNIENYKNGKITVGILEKIVNENTSSANTNLLLEAYITIIEGYRDIKNINYSKALAYCEKGIEISFKISNYEKEIMFKNFRASIELEQGDIEDALRIYETIRHRAGSRSMQFKILFNICICLGKLRKFEEMLREIETIENTCDIEVVYKKYLSMMKANAFSSLKEYDKALKIYQELLIESMESNSVQDMCMLYYNISDIYFEKGDIELSKKYITLRLEQEDDIYISKHLMFAATVFNDLSYLEKAKKKLIDGDYNGMCVIYNKEIELCVKNNNIETLKISLQECIEKQIKIKKQSILYSFMLDNFEKETIKTYLELLETNNCF